jgi:hypothetical protein
METPETWEGPRFVVLLYGLLIALTGVFGYVIGLIRPENLDPKLFMVIDLPPTPLGMAIYGMLTVGIILGVLFVISKLRVDGIDGIPVEVEDVGALELQIEVVGVIQQVVRLIEVEEDPDQRRSLEIALHQHPQPVAPGAGEADKHRVHLIGQERAYVLVRREGWIGPFGSNTGQLTEQPPKS